MPCCFNLQWVEVIHVSPSLRATVTILIQNIPKPSKGLKACSLPLRGFRLGCSVPTPAGSCIKCYYQTLVSHGLLAETASFLNAAMREHKV